MTVDVALEVPERPADRPVATGDLLAFSIPGGEGLRSIEFVVPDVYCAACISTIEAALDALPQVSAARVNLSKRRVKVTFHPEQGTLAEVEEAIRASGYRCHVLDPSADRGSDPALGELVRAMAVAGFAAMNIMLFSVSVWAGADASTRNLFHWISAAIALPAIAYAGQPFFRAAFAALRVGRTNMDVPITIGVSLATGLSLYETASSGAHAYFDASTMLLFFLLVGRTLDHLMRERARGALSNLMRLAPPVATRLAADQSLEVIAIDAVDVGMKLMVRPGDRVPVDCTVSAGSGDIDASMVTGESLPIPVGPGSPLVAGMLNLSGSLSVDVVKPAADSFLAQMVAMMEGAESSRSRYRRLADRAAAIYAPVLHLTAILTLLGWGLSTGDWHRALVNAVAVLIITCPCALALAVPIVQTVAAGRLFRRGVMMRDGAALERAARVTKIIFDKTGTLTEGRPALERQFLGPIEMAAVAATIAAHSHHPLAQALAASVTNPHPLNGEIVEIPGQGVEARCEDGVWRLGSAQFCEIANDAGPAQTHVYLAKDGKVLAGFAFADTLRRDAADAIDALRAAGIKLEILSGDTAAVVAGVAARLKLENYRAGQSPANKLANIEALTDAGERVMMVGDGINDAPALRSASVSMAPSEAADIGRNAADFVFTNGQLASVPFTLGVARRAQRLVAENLTIAVVYNALALPLAIMGQVTPLMAAIAMSGSSLLVVANAMRLNLGGAADRTGPRRTQ